MVTKRSEIRSRPRGAPFVDEFGNRLDEAIFDDIDPALLDDMPDEIFDDVPDGPSDDDGVPDAALFLPFRDGRPGWR